MRLRFRNVGQADQYYKAIRKVLSEAGRGDEGARMGRERIRNAVYRSFGFNHYPDFQRSFVPDTSIKMWFHSHEQLEEAFSKALTDAMEMAVERGFTFAYPTKKLVSIAVKLACEANDRALQVVIDKQSRSMRNDDALTAGAAGRDRYLR